METELGRVVRSSTRLLCVGCQALRREAPLFGSLVKVRVLGEVDVYGLVCDVVQEDDPFVRQVAAAGDLLSAEYVEDMRRNRQVPIEAQVLVVGYRGKEGIVHGLPLQPPSSLDVVCVCCMEELIEFSKEHGYFRLVLDRRDVAADEVLATHIRGAGAARGAEGRSFLIEAGRELAHLLAMDLARLEGILRRISP